jgi:UDP-galactopyranose mutase
MFDYLIVGAGFSGAVLAERLAREKNQRVLIIEKRNHIGGNCYDYYNEEGLLVHKYGPRVFHTADKAVWDYLAQFTEWLSYYHQVLAQVDGVLIPIPCNLASIAKLFSPQLANQLTEELINQFGFGAQVSILDLRQSAQENLRFLAEFIYQKVYLNYTFKHWGLKPEELANYIIERTPIFISYDSRHYKEPYQGIPKHGFNQLFKAMLTHPNIKVMLNTDYREVLSVNHLTKQVKFMGQLFEGKLIYTGKIDELFDYCFGELPYRTLDFKVKTIHQATYQNVATINYPNDYAFTRVSEVKYFTQQRHPYTAIVEEYPRPASRKDVPYYPIPTPENLAILAKYQELAQSYPTITLAGHLADYKYYDMDVAVKQALEKFVQLEFNVD